MSLFDDGGFNNPQPNPNVQPGFNLFDPPEPKKVRAGKGLAIAAIFVSGISLVVSSVLFITTVVFGSAIATRVDSVTVAQSGDEVKISQFGSTRSINASAAAAVAMHSWVMQHVKFD